MKFKKFYLREEEDTAPAANVITPTSFLRVTIPGVKEMRDELTEEIVRQKFPSFINSRVKDAVIGIREDKLVWYAGTFEDGKFDGVWETGSFKDGTFNGLWKNGDFVGGTFKGSFLSGSFKGGTFLDGNFRAGTFTDGVFKGDSFSGDFKGGIFERGIFESGTFSGGSFSGGVFKGKFKNGTFLNGIFDGKWEGGIWKTGKDTEGSVLKYPLIKPE